MRGNYIYRNDTIYRPPSNKCPVSNKRPRLSNLFLLISLPILLCIPTEQAASLQWAPYTNKRPYFVSVIALLLAHCNCGWSSFNCSLRASLQKRWPSSQSLNYYIHVNANFFQTNYLVIKFCGDCPAFCFSQERSEDSKSVFHCLDPF